jgi:glyoxylase-like metal-dependent hydrolase (beta-lactamase superfamily II)
MSINRIATAFAAATLGLLTARAVIAAPAPLQVDVYNPGEKSVFAVSSEIVSGKTDAILIDAQFQRNDAEALVQKIKDSGKKLTTIYISHSDPDYYFGLDVLKAAFPDAKILATPATVAHIKASMQGKLAYWGPILKDNAPKTLVLPHVLQGNSLSLEGRKLDIIGLRGPTPDRTFVWIPSIRTVAGGVVVMGNIHVWIADTQTPASRKNWLKTLDQIDALKPVTVVPGHFAAGAPQTLESVKFTRDYLKTFETEAAKAKTSAELIAAMKAHYPQLGDASSLELSAKVVKGEMKWPQ